MCTFASGYNSRYFLEENFRTVKEFCPLFLIYKLLKEHEILRVRESELNKIFFTPYNIRLSAVSKSSFK